MVAPLLPRDCERHVDDKGEIDADDRVVRFVQRMAARRGLVTR
jgi:hypothetical protein